jgi:eukaryotic-like serine/threonine-protein kinase
VAAGGGKRSGETGTIGEVVDGRYRIVGLVGVGAMGCVYRAEPVAGGDPIALKLLHPELGKVAELARRFEREAMATARVGGPHCVEVLDFGALGDGRLYLAMELLRGRSLAELIEREGRVEPLRALRIASQVLAGLERAHAEGIVHRDLKPENVFLAERDDEEVVVLLDFGLAKLIGDLAIGQEELTRAGFAMGTPTYMAPEWISRQTFDERSDFYSLSVMVYELLTGRPPFRGEEGHEVLRMHAAEEVPAFAAIAPEAEIPAAVEALVRRGLEKRPERRPHSASAFRELVLAVLADPDLPVETLAPPEPEPSPPDAQPEPQPEHTASPPAAAQDGGTALMFALRREGQGAGSSADACEPRREAENQAPPRSPEAASSRAAPASPSAAPPAALPAGRSRSGVAVAAVVGIGVIAILAAIAATSDRSRSAVGDLRRELSAAGFEAGGFAPLATGELGGQCAAGAVSGIPVILCEFADDQAAHRARDTVDMRGRIGTSGSRLLVLRPAPRIDPDGSITEAILRAFEGGGDATR